MAKLKLPKKPKLPRKPKASASVATKKKYIDRVKAIADKYRADVKKVNTANAENERLKKEGERLTAQISGIGSDVFSKGLSVRRPAKRKKASVSGVKRKKAAPKKAAKRKPASRRR